MSRAVEYGEAAIGYSGLTRLQQPSIKALAKTKPNVNYRPTRPPRFIQIDGRFIQIVALYNSVTDDQSGDHGRYVEQYSHRLISIIVASSKPGDTTGRQHVADRLLNICHQRLEFHPKPSV